MMDDDTLKPYLDSEGRITRWPTRNNRSDRQPILSYLATHFESTKIYTEREVNEILKSLHTFEDWALLRREMVSQRIFARNNSGSQYWLAKQSISEYIEQEY